jgi:hypothetical protein
MADKLPRQVDTRLPVTKAVITADGDSAAGRAEQHQKTLSLVIEARSRFYDRVALLSGGAVVLSVSFLGSSASRSSVHALGLLFSSWALLVVCLLCCLFRSPPYQRYVINQTAYFYAKSMLRSERLHLAALRSTGAHILADSSGLSPYRSEEEIQQEISAWDRRTEQLLKRVYGLYRRFRMLEVVALWLFFFGIVFLVGFAILNALANPHQIFR